MFSALVLPLKKATEYRNKEKQIAILGIRSDRTKTGCLVSA